MSKKLLLIFLGFLFATGVCFYLSRRSSALQASQKVETNLPAVVGSATSSSSPLVPTTVAPKSAANSSQPANLPPSETTATPAFDSSSSLPAASASHISTADEAVAFFSAAATPAELLEKADMSNPIVRDFVVARLSEMEETRYESVLEKAAALGIPVRLEGPGNKVSILYAFRGEEPVYRTTQNQNAAISNAASFVRQTAPYNLDGSGVKVGVWDAGTVRNTHREFSTSRVVKKNAVVADDHATHVAGTIGASGVDPKAKGMAPNVSIDSYDWTKDYTEMAASGAALAGDAARVSVSNHSYGYDSTTADMGRYEGECATTDNLANSLPYQLIFWAAGNERDALTTKGGYQSVTYNALAKNVLTVGAVDDAVTSGARDILKATMSYFSNWGPCSDGRIKPDIVANGVGVFSSVSTGDSAYDSYDGTSMATPSAVGSSALLAQLYAREFSNQRMRSSMLKALLIHTADDLGTPGPDYKFGWGLINTKAAADLILAHKASLSSPKMIEGVLSNATRTANQTLQWNGSSPIRATLCWTDPAGTAQSSSTSRAANLRNDLNLKITGPDGKATLPFVMPFVGSWTTASMSLPATRGVNKVDTVEQVLIPAPSQNGTYTISVSYNGTLATPSQTFSLVVTGGTSVESNPPPTVALDSPSNGSFILPSSPVTLSATATDKTLGGATGAIQSVEFRNGNSTLGTDTTAPYSLTWTPPAPGTYSLSAIATDTQGAKSTTTVASLTVLSSNGAPVVTSLSPANGGSGDTVTISGTNLAAATSVRFNGVEAQFTAGLNSLQAVVPSSASTGTVSVSSSFGNGTSPVAFVVNQNPVLISQIYGAGGNVGAKYNADYVELFNRSNATVSLANWSLQYASASGNKWSVVKLSGVIAPRRYFLVKLAGGTNGPALPTPDTTGSANLAAGQGKLALRNTATAFTGSSPLGQTGLQDLVGFGTANTYEGSGAAPAPSATTSIFRSGGGATDTGDNRNDFTAATPNPRNSKSPALP